jgi:hypothetical protein
VNEVVFDGHVIGLRGADAAAREIVDLIASNQNMMRLVGAILASVDTDAVPVAGRIRLCIWCLLLGGALGLGHVRQVALQMEARYLDIGRSTRNLDGVPGARGVDLRLVAGVRAIGDPRCRRAGPRDVQKVASRAGCVDAVHHVDHVAGQRLVRGGLNGSKCGAFAQAAVRIASRPADVVGGAVSGDGERRQGNNAHGYGHSSTGRAGKPLWQRLRTASPTSLSARRTAIA